MTIRLTFENFERRLARYGPRWKFSKVSFLLSLLYELAIALAFENVILHVACTFSYCMSCAHFHITYSRLKQESKRKQNSAQNLVFPNLLSIFQRCFLGTTLDFLGPIKIAQVFRWIFLVLSNWRSTLFVARGDLHLIANRCAFLEIKK